jgi:putative transcriptional regulator
LTGHDAYDALMLDFAAGALGPAQALLVETHLRLKPSARGGAAALDAAGGALLEALEPVEVAAIPLGVVEAASGAVVGPAPVMEARALIEAAARRPDKMNWRWRAPGLRELRLPLAGASLIRLAGGRALAAHGHTGEELTLVLRGGFSDSAGHYDVGDIGFADACFDHSPLVPPGDDCVCLVAMTGALRFHGAVARIAARLLS